jgi:hypothetical protein
MYVCLSDYLPIVARQQHGKDVLAAMKNCWRHRFLCGPCCVKGKQAISSSQNFVFKYCHQEWM